MTHERLSDLILAAAARRNDSPALRFEGKTMTYEALADAVETAARGLLEHLLQRGERVGVYLEKRFETVIALFAAAAAGCVLVPLNPLLKPRQVSYILRDCNVRALVTSQARLRNLLDVLPQCPDLEAIIVVEDSIDPQDLMTLHGVSLSTWKEFLAAGAGSKRAPHRVIDSDLAAILYTSGSVGLPKGVVLSHRNMLTGAYSVSSYLENSADDRILAVLPLSFDYGFSQLTTAFLVGMEVVLMNYLLPRDVIALVARERITGLAGIPSLWIQLAEMDWPCEAAESLRYITNSGGAMPRATVEALRRILPNTRIFLMYGLTEAFRSTFLPPAEVDRRPHSIGKAIPYAEVMVVREDASLCAPGEPGELVHRGPLVALGYWNDPERTAERFRPAPAGPAGLCIPEVAVWSGDTVWMDEEGFLYFIGRRDEMIKTSGYRVSPTEVEEVVYGSGLVGEAAGIGVSHPVLGQAIVVVATAPKDGVLEEEALLHHCRRELPSYMVPQRVIERQALPRNANGKVDRRLLGQELEKLFQETKG
jgi:acyl-CoA ligase (AMP-forming) (exosortase A-associated)